MATTAGRTTMISKSGPVSMTPPDASCAVAYKAIEAEQTTEIVEIPTSARMATVSHTSPMPGVASDVLNRSLQDFDGGDEVGLTYAGHSLLL